jgi:hypothetical protein
MYIPNIFPDISPRKLVDLDFTMYVDDSGETGIVRRGDGKSPPVLKIGGRSDVLESSASREVDSTIKKTTRKEGLVTNPSILFPASFFTPIPPMIHGLFAGPLSIIDNPDLVIGIIAVYAASDKESKSYSKYYEESETAIIDNQELENRLFSER